MPEGRSAYAVIGRT